MLHYLALGVVLGLSAGFAPGPLLTLVVSETLAHGVKAGLKVAVAPLLTDLPIIGVAFLLLARLSSIHGVMAIVSIFGASFLFFLGLQGLRSRGVETGRALVGPKSLTKGVLVNFLSPHPYLFWLTVGGPIASRAWVANRGAAVLFFCGFYLLLVGSKIGLALLVGKSRHFLRQRLYVWVLRFLGVALIVLSLLLFRDGLFMLLQAV